MNSFVQKKSLLYLCVRFLAKIPDWSCMYRYFVIYGSIVNIFCVEDKIFFFMLNIDPPSSLPLVEEVFCSCFVCFVFFYIIIYCFFFVVCRYWRSCWWAGQSRVSVQSQNWLLIYARCNFIILEEDSSVDSFFL